LKRYQLLFILVPTVFLLCSGCRFTTADPVKGETVAIDKKSGLMWHKSANLNRYPWSAAKKYCSDLSYAGYDDWELPSREEIATLWDPETKGPNSMFPFKLEPANYWTRDEEVVTDPAERAKLLNNRPMIGPTEEYMRKNPDSSFEDELFRAYAIRFTDGSMDAYRKLRQSYLLCVRKE